MPLNPDSGAAELMSPGSIGSAEQTVNSVPSDYRGTTAIDWIIYLRSRGLGKPVHVVDIPGFKPDPPVLIGPYWSIETALQLQVEALVGPIASRDLTNSRVSSLLAAVAGDYADWNGPLDPGQNHLAELVDKYTRAYRVAVTPV